jgi:diguanylate cyclase
VGCDVNHILLGDRGLKFAHTALAAMAERAITPSPENYAVWLCYVTGAKVELKAAVDALIQSGKPIDDNVCDDLYVAHFEDVSVGSRMMKAGGKIAAEMQDVVRSLKDVGEHTKLYSSRLTNAKNELAKENLSTNATAVVDNLVEATADMANKSNALETTLLESGREIEVLRAQLEQVKVEASTDALTGIANRKEFEQRFTELSARADVQGQPLSVIMCDIDFFKRVNDTFGHQTGDQVIRFIASVMDRAKPAGGLVARIGGEEFAMLTPKTSLEEAAIIAEKIRLVIKGKRLVRRSTNIDLGEITVSLGVAERQLKEHNAAVLERADEALYASKRTGRNKVTLSNGPARVEKAA